MPEPLEFENNEPDREPTDWLETTPEADAIDTEPEEPDNEPIDELLLEDERLEDELLEDELLLELDDEQLDPSNAVTDTFSFA